MANVSRSIRTLRAIVITIILVVIIAQFWFWLEPASFKWISASHPIISEYGGIGELDTTQKILGFLITLLPKVTLLWSMFLLLRLTKVLTAEKWFDQECEDCCLQIGKWLIAYVILVVVHRTLLVLALTMTAPAGKKELAISISSSDLIALVPALLALIIGHMVKLARAQRDELNEIV